MLNIDPALSPPYFSASRFATSTSAVYIRYLNREFSECRWECPLARWSGDPYITQVLEAARAWRDRCVLADQSVFSDQALWTAENLEDLYRRFTGMPITGQEQTFLEKLVIQIGEASPAVKRLAAEAVWLVYLFPHANWVKPETKRGKVRSIWSLSGSELDPASPLLADQPLQGVGGVGTAYMSGFPAEFGFVLDLMRRWKARPAAERVLGDDEASAWAFAEWMDGIDKATQRPIRNAIAYFLFPDFFERSVSRDHRHEIYLALKGKLPANERLSDSSPSLLDLDKALLKIRRTLAIQLATPEIDFYRHPLEKMWVTKDREERRKQVASALEGVLQNYNLELHQTGSKSRRLADTRATSETTGYWEDPNDATNKPLRWLLHLDLTGDTLTASVPNLHGAHRIAFLNSAKGKSGAVLVRLVPAIKIAADRFEFFETWEWLFLLGFLPNLPRGSSAQLLENFDPQTGSINYKGKRQPYIGAALIALNDDDATYTAQVNGAARRVTYAEATTALGNLLNVDPPFGLVDVGQGVAVDGR